MNRKLITAGATCAIVALSACGATTDAKPAAMTTTAAPSAAPTTSSHPTAEGDAVDGQAVAMKVMDAIVASQTAHMSKAIEGKTVDEGDIEFTTPVKWATKRSSPGVPFEMVLVGGVGYMKGPPGISRKPWFVLESDPKAGPSMDDLFKGDDPREILLMIEGVTGKALGAKQVSGVSTRQYAFEIPISSFVKAFGPAVSKGDKADDQQARRHGALGGRRQPSAQAHDGDGYQRQESIDRGYLQRLGQAGEH